MIITHSTIDIEFGTEMMTEYRVDQFFIIRNSMEGRACVNIVPTPDPRDLSSILLGVGCWAEGELRSGANDEA